MAQFREFDIPGAFAKGRQNALGIQRAEQQIAAERAQAPVRNQLAQTNLQGAQLGLQQAQQGADQKDTLQKAQVINQAATALKRIPEQQRPQALAKMEATLERFGIPRGTFTPDQLTQENIDNTIVATGAFIQSKGDPGKFGRVLEGITPGGDKAFFQAGTSAGQSPRKVEGFTPPKSTAQTKLELKQLEIKEKKDKALESSKQQAGLVSLDIDRALDQATGLTTGLAGSVGKKIPGSPAFDLGATLAGIRANIGFNKLQDMRANSPTGGALGQVSDAENKLLQSVLGSVEQSQSEAQLKRNLARVKIIFDAVIHGTAAIPFTQAQFDALPIGTRYISPDTGTLHEKK